MGTESALTRAMQAMSGRVSWLLALGVLALPVLAIVGMLLFTLYAHQVVPTATIVATLPNPGGTFTAVVEKVDNRMELGQGMLYDEIHLVRSGEAIAAHGDDSQTVIFHTGHAGSSPQVHWTDASHLSVSYTEGADFHAVTRPARDGLVVTYQKQ